MAEQIRLAAEDKYKSELAALELADNYPKPEGWRLSPRMVEAYVLGVKERYPAADGKGRVIIISKYIGSRSMVQVAIATLASDRALLLVGEPGTAKSWLSEHLAAAVCGSSGYIIQGTSGTTEDQIKYSWNYAMLVAKGPSQEALIPSPIYRAMVEGRLSRFEEVTRVTAEIQDSLISLLSEKSIAIPELHTAVNARRGFNIIATANTRDRGVNDMSSALKRRFNFVTVPVVEDLNLEVDIVTRRVDELSRDYEVSATIDDKLVEMLVTMFQELRSGKTKDGKVKVKVPSTVLSTAEVISVLFNSRILGQHFQNARVGHGDLARSMLGAVVKEKIEDKGIFREYCENVVKLRRGRQWQEFYKAAVKVLRE